MDRKPIMTNAQVVLVFGLSAVAGFFLVSGVFAWAQLIWRAFGGAS